MNNLGLKGSVRTILTTKLELIVYILYPVWAYRLWATTLTWEEILCGEIPFEEMVWSD